MPFTLSICTPRRTPIVRWAKSERFLYGTELRAAGFILSVLEVWEPNVAYLRPVPRLDFFHHGDVRSFAPTSVTIWPLGGMALNTSRTGAARCGRADKELRTRNHCWLPLGDL